LDDQFTLPPKLREAEDVISRVRGVTLAKIVGDASQNISEVHVVSNGERTERQIVRDIETTFLTQLGSKIDYRKISVVTLKSPKAAPGEADPEVAAAVGAAAARTAPRTSPTPFGDAGKERGAAPAVTAAASDAESAAADSGARLRFVGLNLQVTGSGCQATVQLKRGEVPTLGDAAGPGPGRAALRSLAEATLGAVTHCYQDGSAFVLEEVAITNLGQSEIVLVSVSYQRGREVISLLGSTYVGVDPQQAVIFATLDAINRFTGRLKERRFSEYEVGPTAGRFQSVSGAK